MKRDSSPPDATFISGPGRVPGLVCAQNSTRSNPAGIAAAPRPSAISVMKRARSSFSGGSSACTAPSSALRGAAAGRRRAFAAAVDIGVVGLGDRASRARRAPPRRRRSPRRRRRSARRARRADRPARRICAPRRAARTAAPRPAPARADRTRSARSASSRAAAGLVDRDERRVERLDAGIDERRRLRRRGAPACAARPTASAPASAAPATASKASVRSCATFSDCIMTSRRSASAASSPGCGASLSSSSTRMAQEIGLLAGALDPGAMLVQRRAAPRAGARGRFDRLRLGLQAAEGVEDRAVRRRIDQRAVVMLAVDLDERGADRAQHLHADRLVVDEGAGAAVGELDAAQDEVAVGVDIGAPSAMRRAGWSAGRSKTAVTWPCGSPVAHERRRRRARRAPARRRRAGWICRRRSRRSGPRGPRRNRARAGRSGRCRGSQAGRAWTRRGLAASSGRPAGHAAEGLADPGCRRPRAARGRPWLSSV